MALPYFNRHEVEKEFAAGSWQRVTHAEFVATLDSNSRPFPCIFGVQGLRDDQLRYTFLDSITADLPRLGCALARFVAESRGFGLHTSLVVFTRPGPVDPLDHYREQFWWTLDQLARIDSKPWPASISRKLDDPAWEFCFAGEPIFVVCGTPAHVARQSRRSSSFMMTFQPRWVFDRILRNGKATSAAVAKVRERLLPYDMLFPSPDLGSYGATANREYKQYFLDEENRPAICPYAELAANKTEAA
jgi:FPC/CPF motif-containing protein YcgG